MQNASTSLASFFQHWQQHSPSPAPSTPSADSPVEITSAPFATPSFASITNYFRPSNKSSSLPIDYHAARTSIYPLPPHYTTIAAVKNTSSHVITVDIDEKPVPQRVPVTHAPSPVVPSGLPTRSLAELMQSQTPLLSDFFTQTQTKPNTPIISSSSTVNNNHPRTSSIVDTAFTTSDSDSSMMPYSSPPMLEVIPSTLKPKSQITCTGCSTCLFIFPFSNSFTAHTQQRTHSFFVDATASAFKTTQ